MPKSALLPERHPERDFFIADIFDAIPVKDDLQTMEHPFFTIDPKPKVRGTHYKRNGIEIEISPHHQLGLPTIHDKDILLYCGSLVMAEVNKGKLPPRTMRFSAHDLLVTTNRQTNGQSYQLLKNAFKRLTGCLITTNIKTTELEMSAGFHILDDYYVVKNSRDGSRMVEIEVTLSYWLYRAFMGKEVLTINRNYFRLRKPLERRLYELARKHCGKQEKWEIGLENLQEKIGSSSTLRKFRYQIRQIIEADTKEQYFPDYSFQLDDNDILSFTHKADSSVKKLSKSALEPPISCGDIDNLLGRLSMKVQNQAMVMAGRGGWDFWALCEEFKTFMQKKGKPMNVNGAFLNFMRLKTKKSAR